MLFHRRQPSFFPLFFYFFLLFLVAPIRAQNASGLQLESVGEEPSGIFWDSSTLQTQTAPLLTLKVTNQTAQACRVHLRWQIADSSGQKRVQKSGDYNLDARGILLIRDLFAAPARGAYLLSAQARRYGSEKWSYAAWPFAIAVKPQAGFRPQSFFVLDAPLLLDESGLDFYARCGARVLRSEMLNDNVPRGVIDNQMQERLKRNLATLAVLDKDKNAEAIPWANRALPILTRYAAVKTWEVAASPDDTKSVQNANFIQAFSNSARAARPDAAWVWPMESGGKVSPSGMAVTMTPLGLIAPGDATLGDATPPVPIPGGVAHPAALRRALLAAAGTAQSSKSLLHIRAQLPQNLTPIAAAGDLVSRYALAIMSGAAAMSVELSSGKTASSAQMRYAQAAAFSNLTGLLEDAAFVDDIFPNSPALSGALFQAGKGSIAVVWPSRSGPPATLKTRLLGARLLDVFGNTLPASDDISIPLGAAPVFVLSDAAPSTVLWALRNGKVEGIAPVAARALPITKIVSGEPQKLSVRLQNLLLQPASGTLRLRAPAGWTLAQNAQKFALAAGEIRDYDFFAQNAVPSRDGAYSVIVALDVEGGSGAWQQDMRVACAANTQKSLRIDGDLRDWTNAQWMEIRPAKADVDGAKVALLWDENYLYIAAQIDEPRLHPAGDANNFAGGDALQLAFGTRGEGKPQSGPFRDTDWSLILSSLSGGQIWMPGQNLPREARCLVRRDERRNQTFYEACVPLASLADLKPATRAAKNAPVRFGWILHNDEDAPLEWSAAVSVFQWWRNPASFAPDTRLFLAAQMPLGFDREGEINAQMPLLAEPIPMLISPTARRVVPNNVPNNSANNAPRKSPPNYPPGGILAPMSPKLLPPFKEPEGKTILPAAPGMAVSQVP